MPENVGVLEIKIEKSSDDSAFSLEKLRERISELKTETKGGVRGLVTTAKHLGTFNESLNSIDFTKLDHLRDVLSKLDKLKSLSVNVKGLDKVDSAVLDKTENPIGKAQNLSGITSVDMGEMSKNTEMLKEYEKQLGKIDEPQKNVAKGIQLMGKTSNKSSGFLGKLVKSIGRIAFYRAIRSAIMGVTKALKEGRDNLYQWSKLQSDSEGKAYSKSLDKTASSFLYLKNSIAAAFAPFVTSIAPYVEKAINEIVKGLNYLSRAFSTLFGLDYWYKAEYQVTEYAKSEDKATESAKKLKKMLLGIDELNVLDSNKDSGSSSGNSDNTDYSSMFSKQRLDEPIEWIADLKIKFKDFLPDFSDWTGEGIAKKIIAGLGALAGGVTGFSIGGVPGAIIGTLIGGTLGVAFDDLLFDGDGKLSKEEIVELVAGAIGGLIGGVAGFKVAGAKGALVGTFVGGTLTATFTKLLMNGDGKLSNSEITNLSVGALNALVGGAIGLKFGGITGGIIGTIAGASLSLVFSKFNASSDKDNPTSIILKSLFGASGALAGGAIGWMIGGPAGAAIGATIGFDLSFTMLNFISENKESIIKKVEDLFVSIFDAAVKLWNDQIDELERVFGKTDFLEKLRITPLSEKIKENQNVSNGVAFEAQVQFNAVMHPDFDKTVSKFNSVKDKNVTLTEKGATDKTFNTTFANSDSKWKGVKNKTVTATANGASGKSFGTVFTNKDSTWKGVKSKSVKITANATDKDGKLASIKKTADGLDGKKATVTISTKDNFTQGVYGIINSIFKAVNSLIDGINKKFKTNIGHIKNPIFSYYDGGGNEKYKWQGFASGGHPDTAEIFYARENGIPEMVGKIGNQPTVATNADIVAAVSKGVASAVSSTMNGANGDVNVNVYLDGEKVYQNVVTHNKQNTIRTGKNALATA